MKEYKIVFTEQFREQVKEKFNYICDRLKSREIAEKWFNLLTNEIIDSLSTLPYKYPIFKKEKDFIVYRLVTKNDVVLYEIDEDNLIVNVHTAVTKGMNLNDVPLVRVKDIEEEQDTIVLT